MPREYATAESISGMCRRVPYGGVVKGQPNRQLSEEEPTNIPSLCKEYAQTEENEEGCCAAPPVRRVWR